jgi:hypothetical protein
MHKIYYHFCILIQEIHIFPITLTHHYTVTLKCHDQKSKLLVRPGFVLEALEVKDDGDVP